jgi:hypothetical protein
MPIAQPTTKNTKHHKHLHTVSFAKPHTAQGCNEQSKEQLPPHACWPSGVSCCRSVVIWSINFLFVPDITRPRRSTRNPTVCNHKLTISSNCMTLPVLGSHAWPEPDMPAKSNSVRHRCARRTCICRRMYSRAPSPKAAFMPRALLALRSSSSVRLSRPSARISRSSWGQQSGGRQQG